MVHSHNGEQAFQVSKLKISLLIDIWSAPSCSSHLMAPIPVTVVWIFLGVGHYHQYPPIFTEHL